MRWRPVRPSAAGGGAAVPLGTILAETSARAVETLRRTSWCCEPGGPAAYPALVLGVPHGAAVHLALAMGVPWMQLDSPWHDFADGAVAADGPVILVHGPCEVDRRQLADVCTWSRDRRRPLRQVLYRDAGALSAAVADLYRVWLHSHGRTGDRLVVECGRLIDAWQVLRAGLVPYWCRNAERRHVDRLAWWLAGSEAFSTITALPEPPDAAPRDLAPLATWEGLTRFATRYGELDPRCRRAYRAGSLPPGHVSAALRGHPNDLPALSPMTPEQALSRLVGADPATGVLVR
jgi:hypothetical protein